MLNVAESALSRNEFVTSRTRDLQDHLARNQAPPKSLTNWAKGFLSSVVGFDVTLTDLSIEELKTPKQTPARHLTIVVSGWLSQNDQHHSSWKQVVDATGGPVVAYRW